MRSRSSVYSTLSGGLLLIGIGLILLLRMPFFPTILAGFATGRGWQGVQGGIWLVGLFFLFYYEIFWPGILILAGVSALIGAVTRPMLSSSNVDQSEKDEK